MYLVLGSIPFLLDFSVEEVVKAPMASTSAKIGDAIWGTSLILIGVCGDACGVTKISLPPGLRSRTLVCVLTRAA